MYSQKLSRYFDHAEFDSGQHMIEMPQMGFPRGRTNWQTIGPTDENPQIFSRIVALRGGGPKRAAAKKKIEEDEDEEAMEEDEDESSDWEDPTEKSKQGACTQTHRRTRYTRHTHTHHTKDARDT